MNNNNSLAHTKWNCKYHIVFAPKFRRKVAYGKLKEDIRDILTMLCKRKGVNIIRGGFCMEGSIYYSAAEVCSLLGISRGKAYQVIKDLNEELEQRGYIVIAGKVPKKFFAEKVYGLASGN